MRLLHTADWHLGQNFYGFSRHYEHQCFLDWLLDTLVDQRIDALLIAGDVFDTANAPAAAQQQLYRFLCAAKQRIPHLQVVLIAGNHDSPSRLEVPSPFLASFDMTVVGQVLRQAQDIDVERLVVPLRDQCGDIRAWCLAVPFLRPGDVPRVEAARDAYLDGIKALYDQTLACALAKRAPGQALIALGHCHMLDSQVSADSERRLVMGGVEALSSSMFGAELAYVGLGHLHLAQPVGKDGRIRYAGSPLPLSFSETRYRHEVRVIELDGERLAASIAIPTPRPVPLQRIPDHAPEALDAVLAQLAQQDWPDRPEDEQPFLLVRVLLDRPEPALRHRIEQALAGKAVRLVKIESHYPARADVEAGPAPSLDDVQRLEPEGVFLRLYRQKYGDAPAEPLLGAFRDLLARLGEDR